MKNNFRFIAQFSAIFLLIVILNLNSISAAEWDNVGTYNSETKTMEVKNFLGLGDSIATITLLSPLNMIVGHGKEVLVAWYEIDNFGTYDGKDIFSIIDTYDLQRGNSEIQKNIVYKKQNINVIQVPKYIESCSPSGNETNCILVEDGTEDKEIIEWKAFNKNSDLLDGKVIIGLFTEVEPQEKVEWIPEMFGVRINEWAVWTSDLNNNLIAYWNFDEGGGSVGQVYVDNVTGKYNLTSFIGTMTTETGKINSAVGMPGSSQMNFTMGEEFDLNNGLTISGWVKMKTACVSQCGTQTFYTYSTTIPSADVMAGLSQVDDGNRFAYQYNGTYTIIFNEWIAGEWVYATQVWNTTDVIIYKDGVVIGGHRDTNLTGDLDGGYLRLGMATNANYIYDEWGYWNRSLTASEITTLYNNGDGLTFTRDVSAIITSTLNFPKDNLITSNETLNFNMTITPTRLNITNATLYIWKSDLSIFNKTTIILTGESANTTILNVSEFIADVYTWNVEGCGENETATLCSFASNNFTLTWRPFKINSQTSTLDVSETSSQDYELEITTLPSILSVNSKLLYNGTNYTADTSCNGIGECVISSTIDVPLVIPGLEEQNKTFFWEVIVFDGTNSFNFNTESSLQEQNVSRIHFENCTSGQTTISLNFTAFDEQNITRIDPFKFDATFDFWLGGGSVKRDSNLQTLSSSEVNLCIAPNVTMFLDSQIEYNEIDQETNYTTRNYFFQNNTVSNETQHIPLYLLKSVSSTSFILKVQDDQLLPLRDRLIFIQRFYPGENVFKTVQVTKTDGNGKTIGFFETEIVDYRFIIMYNNELLLITNPQKIVGESAPFTLTFTIGEDKGTPWGDLEDLSELTYNLFFNKSTNIATFTYSDTSNNFTLARLVVEKPNPSNQMNLTVCSTNSTQSSATINCDIGVITGNDTGTYTARGLITRVGEGEKIISVKNFVIETFSSVAGLLGVFLALFLILISSFAFKFNEIAGIFMINATIIFVNIIGLISFGALAISAMIAVSIIIVAVLER